MRCREAQRAMDELLNGALEHWGPLHEHLRACEGCSGEWRRLRLLDHLAREELRDPVSEADLERMTAGVLRTIAEDRRPIPSQPVVWLRPAVVLGALVAVFLLGLGTGRSLWPQRLVTRQVIAKPYPVERVIRAREPVVRERVVIRYVPAVRTRVVRVEQPATPQPSPASRFGAATREPLPVDEVMKPVFVAGCIARPIITKELVPVTLQGEGDAVHAVGALGADRDTMLTTARWAAEQPQADEPTSWEEEGLYHVASSAVAPIR